MEETEKRDAVVRRRQRNHKLCTCCQQPDGNDAWDSKQPIDSILLSSNINGVLPLEKDLKPDEVKVKIKDFGVHVRKDDDIGYIKYVEKHPAEIEIRSRKIGDLLFPVMSGMEENDFILAISINYCPFCGRKLGIIPKDS